MTDASTARIAAPQAAPHARILGVGGYRPSRLVTNDEIIQNIDSSDEWIRTRSGIVSRRWATEDETVLTMSVAAAGKALAQAGVDASQVGAVIVATVSHFYQTPGIAPQIAHELGMDKPAAFDISAACAGFVHGVSLANDMIRGGSAKYVVVIGVERLSDLTDSYDRSTAFLFADGAGAVVVGPSEEPGISQVVWGSEGDKAALISQKESWMEALHGEGAPFWPHLRQDGQPVFRWASFEMAKVAQQALDAAGITADQLDVFVPHQANMRIIDAMARTLKLPEHVVVARDIAEQGNTSAASVPLAIERLYENGDAKSGDLALLIGFGAGLVYAANVVTLP